MTVMVQTDLNRIFMEKTGINEVQIKKLEQLSKDGLGGSIDQNFSMPIVNGSGSYNYSTTRFWVTISGYATITGPDEGNWHFVAKDGNNIIFDRQGVTKGQQIPFKYKTGFTLNLTLTATWSEKKDTNLTGYLNAQY